MNGLIYLDGDREAATEGCLDHRMTRRYRKGALYAKNKVVPFTFADVVSSWNPI